MTDKTGPIRHSQIAYAARGVGHCMFNIVLIFLTSFLMVAAGAAQNIQFTQGNVGSGLDINLQIPLRDYPGRGEGLPVSLSYSSQVWRINHLKTVENGTYLPITEAIYAEHSTAGWKSSLDIPKVEWPKNEDTYYYTGKAFCHVCGSSFRQFRVARLYIHLPDGSRHELRMSDQPYEGPIQRVGTFYAVDSSRLRYDSTGESTGTLYLPDGTRYKLNGATVQRIDRNGNTLNYDSNTRRWSDTLGRSLEIPLPASPVAGDSPYAIPGIDGPITYTLRWKHLADALTPDPVTGVLPQRRPIANEFLPFPGQPPTAPSGGNYPQFVQTQWQDPPSLFISGSDDMGEGYVTIVGHDQIGGELFNPVVLAEIILPIGLSYKFSYNIYGEIEKVTYPTGAFDLYQSGQVPAIGDIKPPYTQGNRGITSRKLSANGTGSDLATWTYSTTGAVVTSTAPDGTRTETFKTNVPTPGHNTTRNGVIFYWPFGLEDSRQGIPYDERTYAPGENGAMLRRKVTEWGQTATSVQPSIPLLDNTIKTAYRNPRTIRSVSLLLDTGGDALAKTITYGYDPTYQLSTGLDMTVSTESSFASVNQATAKTGAVGAIPAGQLASIAETVYLQDPLYRDERHILGLPTSVVLKDAAGQIVAKTESSYDEPEYPLVVYGDLSAPGWTDPATSARGNVTTNRRYFDIGANLYLESHGQFDQCGNRLGTWNERGILSQVEFSNDYKHAYPTRSISAVPDPSGTHGASAAFAMSSTFDYTTGLTLTTTDANGQTTVLSYKNDQNVTDPLNRLRKATRPDGGWTKYGYNDVPGDLFVTAETKEDGTHTSLTYQYADPAGRPSRSFHSEGAASYIASDTIYDGLGRVIKTSSPYRTTSRDGVSSESHTADWTTKHYDALGRVDLITHPDGTLMQTNYEGVYTTAVDQAGKKRRQKVDGFGRTVRVDEPDANGDLGQFDDPRQATYYDYSTQGNLVHITQGTPAQHRYFKYDALGRLTHERQVEQAGTFTSFDPLTGNSAWSRTLVYDETIGGVDYSGLLTNAYDARGINTQFQYDRLNRAWQVTYSDGTPAVRNNYDQHRAGYFNKGYMTEALTAAAGSVPATVRVNNFDLMGRVVNHQQSVGAHTYTLGYSYNLGGAMTSQTYPSGRVVSYAFDDAARLSQAASGSRIYAHQFDYGTPQGLLKALTFGNGAVQTYGYNSRMQVKSIDLAKSGAVLQRYDYKYGVYDPVTNSLDETKNVGQIARIEGTIGTQQQWQQNFSYDSLGRLSSAREFRGDNGQQSYLINYDYDRFGNRYQKQSRNSGNPFMQIWTEDADIDRLTNRLAVGLNYDNAGNVVTDQKYRQLKFQYDANNRQKQSSSLNDTGVVESVYDAGGQRVATQADGGLTNIMVYDTLGQLVAEYGQTGAGNGGTQYVLADSQGSTRTVMDNAGTVLSRHDYLPFGEEIAAGVGMRAGGQGYNVADGIRQKYAGMETDDATGMAHTLWREYDSWSARWTAPDPYGGSMTTADPQSFNRYNYVNNDPVNKVDPSGLMLSDIGIYQYDNAYDARTAEHASLRELQMSVNAHYQQRTAPPPPPPPMPAPCPILRLPVFDSTDDAVPRVYQSGTVLVDAEPTEEFTSILKGVHDNAFTQTLSPAQKDADMAKAGGNSEATGKAVSRTETTGSEVGASISSAPSVSAKVTESESGTIQVTIEKIKTLEPKIEAMGNISSYNLGAIEALTKITIPIPKDFGGGRAVISRDVAIAWVTWATQHGQNSARARAKEGASTVTLP